MIDDNKMYIILSNIADALRLMNKSIFMLKEQLETIDTSIVYVATKISENNGAAMTWTKFKDKQPDVVEFLYYDHERLNTVSAYKCKNGEFRSEGYYCNDEKCNWTFDDCCCKLIIKPDDYWMPLPEDPKE